MPKRISVGNKLHKIEPLTLTRWGKAGKYIEELAAKGWPTDAVTIFRVMVRILKVACPTLKRRQIKDATADELAKAFHQVMDEWKIGTK